MNYGNRATCSSSEMQSGSGVLSYAFADGKPSVHFYSKRSKSLRAQVQNPNTDSPSSFHADSWAETACHSGASL